MIKIIFIVFILFIYISVIDRTDFGGDTTNAFDAFWCLIFYSIGLSITC